MQKQYKIKVDITKKYAIPAFEVNTNDLKSIRLSIEVLNGASPLDLKDKTVRIAIRKPDNNIVFQDCTITDATNGQVEVILENQAYITPGTHTAEIMCYKGSDVVAVSGTFSYKSSKGIMNDEAVESKTEFTAINRTIEEAERILEDLRENGGGVGVDEQARQGIQEVTKQLADTVKKNDSGILDLNIFNEPTRAVLQGLEPGKVNAVLGDGNVKISNLSNELIDRLGKYETISPTIKDGYYVTNSNTFTPGGNFKTAEVSCSPGEKYSIDTTIRETITAVVIFYDSSGNRLSYLQTGTGADVAYKDFRFTVPANATLFRSLGRSGITPVVRKLTLIDMANMDTRIGVLGAYKNGNTLRVISKYDKNNDFIVTMGPKGMNSLYGFANFNVKPNTNKKVSKEIDTLNGATQLLNVYSDWIGPYVVQVVNNADGDNQGTTAFTGGFHAYDGGQSGGATARTVSTEWFVDGNTPSDGVYYDCQEIIVKVTNNIQSYQTKKANGSGREVLKEVVTYTFKPSSMIEVEVEISALEAIKIITYMGHQSMTADVWNGEIFFEDDPKRKWYGIANEKVSSGNKTNSNAREYTVRKNNNYLKGWINDFGLGKYQYITNNTELIYSNMPTAAKVYFNLVKDGEGLSLATSEIVKWSGGYKFFGGNA